MNDINEITDDQIIATAKLDGWYWGEADFGHGFRNGWCKGEFAHGGFAADTNELRIAMGLIGFIKKSNEQTFKNYIAESKAEAITVEWVNWMLDLLMECNRSNSQIDPSWLRASVGLNHPYARPKLTPANKHLCLK